MIKYIILDVDRTLVDSFEPELLSFQEAIENVTGIKMEREQLKKMTTMTTSELLQSLDLSDEEIEGVKEEWHVTYVKYKIKCFEGIKEAIKELHEKGYTLGIITSRTESEYHELDEELEGIGDLFQAIVTSDKIKHAKPNPESMNYLCNELNCSSEEVIYVGDSYGDKEFAANSNCSFIPICYENKELINEENACFDPKELPTIVEKISKEKINNKGVHR